MTAIKYNQDANLARRLFDIIRDIPYRIPLTITDSNNSCHGKSILLHHLLKSYGFDSRIMVCTFKWSSNVNNKGLLPLIIDDLQYHYFVEIHLHDNWIRLDCAFDSGLGSKLSVNEWDGISDTKIAVAAEEFLDAEQSARILQESNSPGYFERKIRANGKMYKMLNSIYEHIRNKK